MAFYNLQYSIKSSSKTQWYQKYYFRYSRFQNFSDPPRGLAYGGNNNNATIFYQDKPFSKTAGINGCPGSVNYN